MTSKPLISVVMPVFNGERFLKEAIECILNQSLSDFEFIIIDDGSTDRTPAILRDYQALDRRIRIHQQSNQGIIASLNTGCRLARGKYIARTDSDDVSLPARFERQAQYLESHPEVDVLGTWFQHLTEEGMKEECHPPQTHELILWSLCFRNSICHPSVMMRRSRIDGLGFYRSEFLHCEDYDLWVRAGERLRLANLPEILVLYRITGASVSKVNTQVQNDNHLRLMRVMMRRFVGDRVSAETVETIRQLQTTRRVSCLTKIDGAERTVLELRGHFLRDRQLSASEMKWIQKDVTSISRMYYLQRVAIDPRAVFNLQNTLRFVWTADPIFLLRCGRKCLKISYNSLRDLSRKVGGNRFGRAR